MDNVSVIIRNRNESEFIGFAIQSCLDHLVKPEIIIVDNQSTDDSLEIVNLFKNRASIKVVTINDYTPGKSINLGVRHASNKYILVLSAHAQITKLDLDLVKSELEYNVAVMGQQNPIYRGKKISKRYIWSHFGNKTITNLYSDIEGRYFLHNAFCFYKKDIIEQYPMPEDVPGKEDRYWIRDLVDIGYDFLYTPELTCNHFYTTGGATWKGIG